jgi:hypothetical protein
MSDDVKFSIFNDPPTAELIELERRYSRSGLTTGEKVMLGPGVLGLEVLVGAAIDAYAGQSNFLTGGKRTPWDEATGALACDWSASIFTQRYAEKVRAQGRELVRGEVAAMRNQLDLEGSVVSVAKTVGNIAGTISDHLAETLTGKKK